MSAERANQIGLEALRLHHIGIVTAQLDRCIAFYQALGYSASETFSDPHEGAQIVLMQRAGGPILELICPDSPESPAANWIARIHGGPYHLGYEVPGLEKALRTLREHGFAVAMGPVPAVAFGMRRVAFVWNKLTGLIELLEQQEKV